MIFFNFKKLFRVASAMELPAQGKLQDLRLVFSSDTGNDGEKHSHLGGYLIWNVIAIHLFSFDEIVFVIVSSRLGARAPVRLQADGHLFADKRTRSLRFFRGEPVEPDAALLSSYLPLRGGAHPRPGTPSITAIVSTAARKLH
ncbi:MAG: hypothetical protein Q9P14_16960 [candidate division KSB1 bacterium]|nr:hypothetical protein [candidate division KSB1 bacterium]